MGNKEDKEADYQSFLLIGAVLLLVGFLEMARNSGTRISGVMHYFYAMFLFIQAYFKYHKEEELLKDFLS